MSYIWAATKLEAEEFVQLLGPHLGETETTTMLTGAQKLFNKGLAEGLETGRAEGLETGAARVLLAQIQLRYGEPSAEVVRRVESATPAEREAWIRRIFEAATVEELLG